MVQLILGMWISLVLCGAGFVQSSSTADEKIEKLQRTIGLLGRQVMMQQLFAEERIRSDGDSGIKNIRLNTKATNPYLTQTYTRKSNSAMHDHSNNIRTIGMGEVVVVLNGVEFRTRHNDYRLYMPGATSEANSVQDVPFPEVPPEVLNKATVEEQIEEMQLWFKAFKNQDNEVRDYRKYFKPVLCYMEGMWTIPTTEDISEPFESDRHHIDASSWFDLQEKIRFASNTGTKSNLENFAFLPTTVADVTDNATLTLAQWNYKILCHNISRDLPLNRFRMVDDFSSRMVREFSMKQQELSRAARFILNPEDTDTWSKKEQSFTNSLLDDLMYEIPGADNYAANIADEAFGVAAKRPDDTPLNAGYYHRVFKNNKKGAMGLQLINRGFNDQNFFVALNDQPHIMALSYEHCKRKVCNKFTQKATYAIPLEIIYLTPLYNWNPYNILYRGTVGDSGTELVQGVNKERNGQPTKELAYNGVHSKLFYRTPKEFFGGSEINRDAADTSANFLAVLGDDGEPKNVSASGTRIFLPTIADLGNIRLRYPINPVHDEGSVTRKELEAVKKAFLELNSYMHMLRDPPTFSGQTEGSGDTVLRTSDSTDPGVTTHYHTIDLTTSDLKKLMNGEQIKKITSLEDSHQHEITFKYVKGAKAYKITKCDSKRRCWDGHSQVLTEIVQ